MKSKVDIFWTSFTVFTVLLFGVVAHAADPCVGVCSIYADDAETVTQKVGVTGSTEYDLKQACAADAGYYNHPWSVEVTSCQDE
jgi:hypothetical protein